MRKIFASLFILIYIAFLAAFPDRAGRACLDGLLLFAERVLPGLLPFMVITGIMTRTGGAELLSGFLSPVIEGLFHVNAGSALAFATGLLSGNPASSKVLKELWESGRVTSRDAENALAICCYVSPAFLLVSAPAMLGEPNAVLPLIVGHISGGILTGVALRPVKRPEKAKPNAISAKPMGFGRAIVSSVSSAAIAIPEIAVYVALFSVASEAVRLLPVGNAAIALISGLLEFTTGTARLAEISMWLPLKLAIVSFFVSFGGLSVFCQANSFTEGFARTKVYMLQRLVHGAFGFAATYSVASIAAYGISCRILLPLFAFAIVAGARYIVNICRASGKNSFQTEGIAI